MTTGINACLEAPGRIHDHAQRALEGLQAGLCHALQGPHADSLHACLRQLHYHLDMRFPIPPEPKAWLAERLYGVLTTLHADQSLIEGCCVALVRLLKRSERLPLVLDWRPLLATFEGLYFRKQRAALRARRTLAGPLVSAAACASRYFGKDAAEEILANFRPQWCPLHHLIFKSQALVSLLLPTHCPVGAEPTNVPWLEEWLGLWGWVDNSLQWDLNQMALLARVAEDRVGMVDWEPHVPLIFTNLVRMLDLPVGRVALPTVPQQPATFAIQIHAGNDPMDEAGKLIVWMLSERSSTQVTGFCPASGMH